MTDNPAFLVFCKACNRKHYMTHQPCPTCGVYTVPQPKSEKVYNNCTSTMYKCDGCEAYEDRYR